MKFSIIVPAYNAEGRIHRALGMVKVQSFQDYELIVVCDSCTDRTEEIARSYGAITASVNYHNDGLTRSKGLDMASGEWVLFIDDDDWWLHEFVLEQLNAMLTAYEDQIDLLCFSFIFRGRGYASPTSNNGAHWYAVWNKAWRRSLIGDTRFPNVPATSDVGFTDAVLAKNPRYIDWDMPMYYYNFMREGSITHGLSQQKVEGETTEDPAP